MKGIVIMDKPPELTSFKSLGIIKKAYGTKRVGHTGTLDPNATGVLPILIGSATRAADLLVCDDKEYITTFLLGVKTDTLDLSGQIIQKRDVNVSCNDVQNIVSSFMGNIYQTPPMYSALSVDGVRLHKLARQGIEVQRPRRSVTIHEIEITDISLPRVTMRVSCSKGTYIRTLVDDIGEKLNCGAAVESLRRTKTGIFTLKDAHTPKEIETDPLSCLLPLDICFPGYEKISLDERMSAMVKNGVPVYYNSHKDETLRVYDSAGEFIALSKVTEIDGRYCLKMIKGFY